MHSSDLLHLFTTQVTDQRLSDRRSLWRHTPAVPDVHFDKPWRFDPFDVHSITMIQDRKVGSETRGLNELSQMRHRELPQGHTLHRLPTETQNADAERVVSGFGITPYISTSDQRAQNVTGRALRHSRDTADLGRAQPVISAGQKLKNRQRPLN